MLNSTSEIFITQITELSQKVLLATLLIKKSKGVQETVAHMTRLMYAGNK